MKKKWLAHSPSKLFRKLGCDAENAHTDSRGLEVWEKKTDRIGWVRSENGSRKLKGYLRLVANMNNVIRRALLIPGN